MKNINIYCIYSAAVLSLYVIPTRHFENVHVPLEYLPLSI